MVNAGQPDDTHRLLDLVLYLDTNYCFISSIGIAIAVDLGWIFFLVVIKYREQVGENPLMR